MNRADRDLDDAILTSWRAEAPKASESFRQVRDQVSYRHSIEGERATFDPQRRY